MYIKKIKLLIAIINYHDKQLDVYDTSKIFGTAI